MFRMTFRIVGSPIQGFICKPVLCFLPMTESKPIAVATFPYTPQGQKFMPEFIEVSWVAVHPSYTKVAVLRPQTTHLSLRDIP